MQPTTSLVKAHTEHGEVTVTGTVQVPGGTASFTDVNGVVLAAMDMIVSSFGSRRGLEPNESRRSTRCVISDRRERTIDLGTVSFAVAGLIDTTMRDHFEVLIASAVDKGVNALHTLANQVMTAGSTAEETSAAVPSGTSESTRMPFEELVAYFALSVADLVNTVQASIPGFGFVEQLWGHLVPSNNVPLSTVPANESLAPHLSGQRFRSRGLPEHELVNSGNGRKAS